MKLRTLLATSLVAALAAGGAALAQPADSSSTSASAPTPAPAHAKKTHKSHKSTSHKKPAAKSADTTAPAPN